MESRRWFLGAAGASLAGLACGLPAEVDAAALPLVAIEPRSVRSGVATVRVSTPTIRIAASRDLTSRLYRNKGAVTAAWSDDDRIFVRTYSTAGAPRSAPIRLTVDGPVDLAGSDASDIRAVTIDSNFLTIRSFSATGKLQRDASLIVRTASGSGLADLGRFGEVVFLNLGGGWQLLHGNDLDAEAIRLRDLDPAVQQLAVTGQGDYGVIGEFAYGTDIRIVSPTGLELDARSGLRTACRIQALRQGVVAATWDEETLQIDFLGVASASQSFPVFYKPAVQIAATSKRIVVFILHQYELSAVVLDHAGEVVSPLRVIARVTGGSKLVLSSAVAVSEHRFYLGLSAHQDQYFVPKPFAHFAVPVMVD